MEEKRKRGRPRLKLDENQIFQLGVIGCTYNEIAAVMDCSYDTIVDNYSHVVAKGRESGKISLRKAQFKNALNGNATMQIWLGKQKLGQAEKIEQKIEASVDLKLAEALDEIPNESKDLIKLRESSETD